MRRKREEVEERWHGGRTTHKSSTGAEDAKVRVSCSAHFPELFLQASRQGNVRVSPSDIIKGKLTASEWTFRCLSDKLEEYKHLRTKGGPI
ncbi:unnamed protein product [Pleuronectes platessa]|uniref:Uncharacterized protein n=1 Tax=Pleuronectes platessa TaxID=8262 RepID=A0A9N7YLD5_PLEPL|nr:unnamed protein product [Pleuronectes platessa]